MRKDGGPLAECKECARKRRQNYADKNRPLVQARQRAYQKRNIAKHKELVFAAYGGYRCNCCGETEKLFLTIDHIDNNGATERKQLFGKRASAGYPFYKWLVKNDFPPGYQVLCMNCNFGKRMNNGVCPHKIRCNDYPKGVGSSDPKRTAPHLEKEGEDIV